MSADHPAGFPITAPDAESHATASQFASPPPARRLTAAAEVILCSGFPTQLLLVGLLQAFGWRAFGPDGDLSLRFVAALSLLDAAIIIGLIWYFLARQGETLRGLLLGGRQVRREGLLGLQLIPVIFLLAVLLLVVIRLVAPGLHNVPRNPLERMLRAPGDYWLFGLVVVVGGGIREECQRAFILRRFEQYLGGSLPGLLLSSAAFGIGHVDQGLDAAVATGVLGAIWGVIYLRRRSAIAAIVSHSGFNLAEVTRHLLFAP